MKTTTYKTAGKKPTRNAQKRIFRRRGLLNKVDRLFRRIRF